MFKHPQRSDADNLRIGVGAKHASPSLALPIVAFGATVVLKRSLPNLNHARVYLPGAFRCEKREIHLAHKFHTKHRNIATQMKTIGDQKGSMWHVSLSDQATRHSKTKNWSHTSVVLHDMTDFFWFIAGAARVPAQGVSSKVLRKGCRAR